MARATYAWDGIRFFICSIAPLETSRWFRKDYAVWKDNGYLK